MKILQLIAGGETGGAELFFARLVCALADRSVDQFLLIRKHRIRNNMFREKQIPFHEIRYGNPFDFYSGYQVEKIAKSYQPDIVFSWMNRASKFSPKGPWKNVGRLGGYYNLKYYKNCQHLVCNTEDIWKYVVAQGWPSDRAIYIPNFVNEEKSPAIDRSEVHTPLHVPVIVAAGRLHRNKAMDTLIAAMAYIAEAYLWIAGAGPEENNLKQMTGRLNLQDRVRFLGWQENINSVYAAADIFVCPSRHEPLGNVILEAWSQGIPVIATRSQGPCQLISDRINGLLVPVDDPVAMAGAIKKLAADKSLARNLVSAGIKSYVDGYSKKIVVDKYLEFFSKLCQ